MESALLLGRPSIAGGYGAILGLLAAALVCRAGAALWWGDLLWADSVFYRQVTDALEKGDFTQAFASLGLNVYPVVLMWLDWLGAWVGADWTVVGKWWSVALGSLAVLPFYGWVHRLFNDRIAFWAGLFFAIHPHLVGHSPLIIRDPTYWFLFNLALYLSWRAVTETRYWLFLAAGVSIGLAMYTRTEGILLVGVLVGWALYRAVRVREGRWRLVFGVLLAVGVIPAGAAAVNLTWLRDHPQWEWGRLPLFQRMWNWAAERFEDLFSSKTQHVPSSGFGALDQDCQGGPTAVSPWERTRRRDRPLPPANRICSEKQKTPALPKVKSLLASKPAASQKQFSQKKTDPNTKAATYPLPSQKQSSQEETLSQPAEAAKTSEWVQARRAALRLVKALAYPYALLIGIGLVRGWRILLRADQIVITGHNLLLFLANWAYQSLSGGIDYRYFFPILMTALPYAVGGFEAVLAVVCRAATLGRRTSLASSEGRLAAAGGVLLLAGLGLLDVQPSAAPLMRQQTALGQWILRTQGPGAKILCTESAAILLGYHAQAECWTWPLMADGEYLSIQELLENYRPDVIALWDDPAYPDRRWMGLIVEVSEQLGYQEVPYEELPESARRVRVWRRPRTAVSVSP